MKNDYLSATTLRWLFGIIIALLVTANGMIVKNTVSIASHEHKIDKEEVRLVVKEELEHFDL